MAEIWKDIPEYEGLYQASNLGRVKGLKIERVYVRNGRVHSRITIETVISTSKSGKYKVSKLVDSDGRRKTIGVHVLILSAFGEKQFIAGLHCLHKDDNPTNNIPDNLYWGTRVENAKDAKINGKVKIGEHHPSAKLNEKNVKDIRQKFIDGVCQVELAKEYGVVQSTIGKLITGRTWKHIS